MLFFIWTQVLQVQQRKYTWAIVMFLSVLRHLKIQKPTSQQGRKTNKRK
jgi:hypothetical protein